jgi:hypothetical protein
MVRPEWHLSSVAVSYRIYPVVKDDLHHHAIDAVYASLSQRFQYGTPRSTASGQPPTCSE